MLAVHRKYEVLESGSAVGEQVGEARAHDTSRKCRGKRIGRNDISPIVRHLRQSDDDSYGCVTLNQCHLLTRKIYDVAISKDEEWKLEACVCLAVSIQDCTTSNALCTMNEGVPDHQEAE